MENKIHKKLFQSRVPFVVIISRPTFKTQSISNSRSKSNFTKLISTVHKWELQSLFFNCDSLRSKKNPIKFSANIFDIGLFFWSNGKVLKCFIKKGYKFLSSSTWCNKQFKVDNFWIEDDALTSVKNYHRHPLWVRSR